MAVDRSRVSKSGTCLALAAVLALSLFASACGSSKQSGAVVISSGQIDTGQVQIQPPPGYTITTNARGATKLVAGHESKSELASTTGGSTDTIPLAGEDPTTKFFGALGTFQGCLKGLGTKFIGIPNKATPNSPANDPNYIKALSTCAAKSNIVTALKDEQSAQNNLTPAQIKTQNKGYLKWRDCMISRGWGIPEPKPDSEGRLFSFGAGSSGGGSGGGNPGAGFTAPPGQDIVTSPDVSQCATQAQKEVSPNSGG